MQDDLLDAKAAIEWAVAQDLVLMKRLALWRQNKPCTVKIDTHSDPGKKIYRLVEVKPIDPLVTAEIGAIVHSIRSSLDLLACTLAARNGMHDSTKTYFPIWRTEADFLSSTSKVMEKIRSLSSADQDLLKNLKPYPGGNDLLCTLHTLDLTRKHRRLLRPAISPKGIALRGVAVVNMPSISHIDFNEEAVLAWTDASEPDSNLSITPFITFNEAGHLNGHEVRTAISKFVLLAVSIVNQFD